MTETQSGHALTKAGAVGVIIGGAYGVVVMGLGLWGAAEESYPLFFGLRLRGDSGYPFPDPNIAALGVLIAVLGATFAAIFVKTATGSAAARRAAIAGLALVVVGAGWTAQVASGSRRCAFESYSETNHCMSGTAATLRDFVILAVPALVALGCLTFRRARRRSD